MAAGVIAPSSLGRKPKFISRFSKLAEMQITLSGKAGDHGKLFGSFGTRDIEKALEAHGIVVAHRDIKLEQPIKTIGLHSVEIRLEGDVRAQVNIVVVPENEPSTPTT